MAIRTIRTIGDEILTKKCKEVKRMTPRTMTLIEDMFNTMYEAAGVGLAAPQVGILKRIITIDLEEDPMVLINPVLMEQSGSQTGDEGCLSVPDKVGVVTRPDHVKVKALDAGMEERVIEAEGLLARAICHEMDHLEGKLYVDLVEGDLRSVEDVVREGEAEQ